MAYREFERNIFNKTRNFREFILRPLLNLLSQLKITANHITYLRGIVFVFGVMYPMFVRGNLIIASIVYFLVFWMLDAVDGQLARHTHKDNDKGKFNDIYTDILGYSFYVMGLAFLDVANIFILFYHVIIHGSVYVIAAIQKNENEKSDWIVKLEPNLVYFKFLAHTLVLIFLVFHINWLDLGFIILNIWMTFNAIIYFIKLQTQKYKNN